jgi:EAL domain-containing protein (putative c-di-GMP-specific phosphodiesterase class I)
MMARPWTHRKDSPRAAVDRPGLRPARGRPAATTRAPFDPRAAVSMADAAAQAPAGGDRATSEETLLLDHLRRVRGQPAGYFAVHVRLSELRALNKQPHFINIAARSFDIVIANHEANLFPLSNSDLVLVCRETPAEEVDAIVVKVRGLFSEDPLTSSEHGGGEDRFSVWYDLSRPDDLRSFTSLVNDLAAAAEARRMQEASTRAQRASAPPRGSPISPKSLGAISQKLKVTQVADLIRNQAALRVVPGGRGEVVFREHFVAIADLKGRVAPDVNLFANPWLFQYFTEALDRRVLAVMARWKFDELADAISLNLNIGTVLSKEFAPFAAAVGGRADRVVVEMQLIDIFSDIGTFWRARDWLKEKGFRVLVDGLNPIAIQFFDPSPLRADFFKVAWGPEFIGKEKESHREEMREVIGHTGKDTVILARVDSEDALRWGLSLGITRFQGYFIDKLVAAIAAQYQKR